MKPLPKRKEMADTFYIQVRLGKKSEAFSVDYPKGKMKLKILAMAIWNALQENGG